MAILSTPPHAAGVGTSGWKRMVLFVSGGSVGSGACRLGFGVPGFAFRVSVGKVLFEDVGIFGFCRMLDFQMLGCWWIVTSNAFVLG